MRFDLSTLGYSPEVGLPPLHGQEKIGERTKGTYDAVVANHNPVVTIPVADMVEPHLPAIKVVADVLPPHKITVSSEAALSIGGQICRGYHDEPIGCRAQVGEIPIHMWCHQAAGVEVGEHCDRTHPPTSLAVYGDRRSLITGRIGGHRSEYPHLPPPKASVPLVRFGRRCRGDSTVRTSAAIAEPR